MPFAGLAPVWNGGPHGPDPAQPVLRPRLQPRLVVRFLLSCSGIGGPMKKFDWVKPVLVRKPVSATAQGAGSNTDGIGGEFPIQS